MKPSEMYRIAADAFENVTPYSRDPVKWFADVQRANELLASADKRALEVYGSPC